MFYLLTDHPPLPAQPLLLGRETNLPPPHPLRTLPPSLQPEPHQSSPGGTFEHHLANPLETSGQHKDVYPPVDRVRYSLRILRLCLLNLIGTAEETLHGWDGRFGRFGDAKASRVTALLRYVG